MKYQLLISTVLALALRVTAHAGMPVEQGDIPVAPIARVDTMGWKDVFLLKNPAMELVIDPARGRIVHLKIDHGEEFLGVSPETAASSEGGHWLWPVDEPHGEQGTPPAYLGDEPWDANAWEGADGSRSCRMTRKYGPPLNIRVTRTVKLDKQHQFASVRQRIERIDASDIPVVLRSITRVTRPGQVVIPDDDATRHNEKRREGVQACEASIVCDSSLVQGTRICSSSSRNWIAAQKGEFVLIQKAHNTSSPTDFSHECHLALTAPYSSPDARLEMRSEEMKLEVGDSIENTISIHCFAIETNVPLCRLSKQVESLLGER